MLRSEQTWVDNFRIDMSIFNFGGSISGVLSVKQSNLIQDEATDSVLHFGTKSQVRPISISGIVADQKNGELEYNKRRRALNMHTYSKNRIDVKDKRRCRRDETRVKKREGEGGRRRKKSP